MIHSVNGIFYCENNVLIENITPNENTVSIDYGICPFGCVENVTRYGADCIPTEFELFYTGWGSFIIALMGLLFLAFLLKRKKKKSKQRWL